MRALRWLTVPFLRVELEEAAFCTLDLGKQRTANGWAIRFHYYGWRLVGNSRNLRRYCRVHLGRAHRSPSERKLSLNRGPEGRVVSEVLEYMLTMT
jgi:hypothetical protein